MSEQDSFTS